MFSRAEADLVRRDDRIPGLALVLDPVAFSQHLQSRLDSVELKDLSFDYVRYKPGTNCLSAFTAETSNGRISGYAKAYGDKAVEKLEKARQREHVPGVQGPGQVLLEEHQIEVNFFPNDNRLPTLSALSNVESRNAMLARVFTEVGSIAGHQIELLRYKPERRYVARLTMADNRTSALKLYTSNQYESARDAARMFLSTDDVQFPRLIGRSNRHQVLAFDWNQGRELGDMLTRGDVTPDVLGLVGRALEQLHAQTGAGLHQRTRQAEAESIQAIADAISFLHPPCAGLARSLVQRLCREMLSAPIICSPIHGDFYSRQVLVDDHVVTILDLDEAVMSDPAADIGLFFAHLERDAIRGELSDQSIPVIEDSLLHGYGRLPERIALYTAVGLLQLTPHYFRNRDADWVERTIRTLERATEIVESERSDFSRSSIVKQVVR